ncbi:hypothetical protein [Streptomyces hainanensis]|uniref:Uncharacterized protein n=1 Tax=Streptomyces hainanensis TaxID=402648 RepID=A0A4R4TA26_9ACTN|nr:hypothetical protein [Streptomyces hainanensis]TDC72846.1 hypothetical protein E1283_20690 [Streptomyces hainanensis]
MWFSITVSAVMLGLAWFVVGGFLGLGNVFRRAWHAYRAWAHRRYLAGLPPPTVAPGDVRARAREVFSAICDAAGPQGYAVMEGYFTARRWNESDVRIILRELLNRGLVTAHPRSRHLYAPTARGADVYGRGLMDEAKGQVSINATHGGSIVGVNVHSDGATAQVGTANQATPQVPAYREIVTALRADATTARDVEAHAARNHADDLEEALAADDPPRVDRVIGRINALLAAATSAFAITRGMLPPNG